MRVESPQPTQPPAGRPVPDLPREIDATGISACAILSSEQLVAVRMDPASAEDSSDRVASSCRWRSADRYEKMTLIVNSDYAVDLLYAASDAAPFFEEFELRGQPAAREDPPDSSICTIYVVLARDQLFTVEYSTQATDRPVRSCEAAESTAGQVIDAIAARR
ncbi:hypothetical protein GCM10023175_45310 [Pseudonocardia xishanensis]|uniref:DUF3558 domain-containing protein n=1 Tax=Pseudonocardia xishanensis TaxID=630995 RepID=A0ABP8RY56_9PSEU